MMSDQRLHVRLQLGSRLLGFCFLLQQLGDLSHSQPCVSSNVRPPANSSLSTPTPSGALLVPPLDAVCSAGLLYG